MSPQDPKISEDDLANLFEALPEHCIVLLEDIDTAGLPSRQTQPEPPVNVANIANTAPYAGMPMPKPMPMRKSAIKGYISLSGLLNVIDGVSSREGRVLIMTTNHIENLDNALLRPGRVDVRIQFELATKELAKTLFMQIFSADDQGVISDEKGLLKKAKTTNDPAVVRLRELAEVFADLIPDKKLSPAEIQGFLINWKKSPEQAVVNAEEWVGHTLAAANRG